MNRTFTGKHMAMLLVGGFGVVIAVNLLMATLAVGGFSGVVVENSHVASQRFNGWLDEAKQQQALGWSAKPKRLGDGRVAVISEAVPPGAHVSAKLRRPLGKPQATSLAFSEQARGEFISASSIAPGRWIIRLTISDNGQKWVSEGPLP